MIPYALKSEHGKPNYDNLLCQFERTLFTTPPPIPKETLIHLLEMISTNDSTNFRVHVKSSTGTGFQNLRQKDLESPAIGLLSTKSQHSPVVSNTNFHLAIFRQFDHQAVKFQIHEFHGFPRILRILGSFHVVHVLRKKWGSITDLQGHEGMDSSGLSRQSKAFGFTSL